MNRPSPLLTISGVAKAYGSVVALEAVDMTVRRHEIHALLGANGAGKSTLVRILAGVHPADRGTLEVEGKTANFQTPVEAMRGGMATVFQDPALIRDLTIAQNLRLSQTDPATFEQWLEEFDLGSLDRDRMVRDLPLDILRLVDLARALALNPKILLLDEITAALTADQAEKLFELLDRLKTEGCSVVLITHRLAEVMRICDTATILRDGCNVAELEVGGITQQELVLAMLGSPVDLAPDTQAGTTAPTTAGAETVFAVEELASGEAVRQVSFAVRRGEVLGLVALEGQGQERVFDILCGERRPSSGRILVDGSPCRFLSPADAVRQGVVLIPGDRLQALLPSLPVYQNLVVTLITRIRQWLGLPADERARAANAIDSLSIDTRAAAQVRRLSGGNQQKVAIGRWLVSGFRTLLCFDPTRGIDIQTKGEIYALLRKLAADGAAVLLYTSELAEIPLVCDRVLVMHNGLIVDEQAAAQATEASLLTAAHGLV